ncbi:MAG: hypothetical protein NTV81_03835, partial [Candidatus Komeilibacteria bacterium]|nr:hypothetical protein [Candidatus Komeilibacteria bacterium]
QWWWAYDEERVLVSRNSGLDWEDVPTNLPINVSHCSLAVDHQGNCWLGTSKGLCLAVASGGFERVALPERKVRRLWVVGQDLLAATAYSVFHCGPSQDWQECWSSGSSMLDELVVKDSKIFALADRAVYQLGYFKANEEEEGSLVA